VKTKTKLYTDEIRAALEYQRDGPGTPRLFKVEFYRIEKREYVWGIEIVGNCERQAPRLAARIAATLMNAGFNLDAVLAFSDALEVHPRGTRSQSWPTLCWPNYPNKWEAE
jgi:hypothetical protein